MNGRPIHGVIEPGVTVTLCGRVVARCIVVDCFAPIVDCKRCLKELEWA